MAKRKTGSTLFEVFFRGKHAPKADKGRRRGPLRVPGWAEAGRAPASQAAVPARVSKPLKEPPGLESAGAEPFSTPPAAPTADRTAAADEQPVVAIGGRRLNLSFSYVSCSVAVLALLVLLAAAYKLGQISGRRQMAPGMVSKAAAAPDGASAHSDSALPGPMAPPPSEEDYSAVQRRLQAKESQLVPGHKYLVVQGDVRNRDDALAIQRYLYENGRDTIILSSGSKLMVVFLKDLQDGRDETEVRDHVAAFRRLGASEAWKLRSLYNFKQKNDYPPWFYITPRDR